MIVFCVEVSYNIPPTKAFEQMLIHVEISKEFLESPMACDFKW